MTDSLLRIPLNSLSPDLTAVVTWMLNQPVVTLDQVGQRFGVDEAIARVWMQELVALQFVKPLLTETESASPEVLYQLQDFWETQPIPNTPNNGLNAPLAFILNPSGEVTTTAGKTFELRVAIANQGPIGAVINVYIDETSQPLRDWCDNSYQRLALSPQQSSEVVFHFAIPPLALAQSYDYLLILDAPEHYPEATPIRHEGRLQVQLPIEAATQVNDPTFSLPQTSSHKPAIVQPGQPFDLRVVVHNRSNRVDRFRLACNDFPADWYEIIYPENLNDLGLVMAADNLPLNPGAMGDITLRFILPEDSNAGQYFPTLQLHSLNLPDLVLMDVAYLQVLPRYQLDLELRTLVGKIKRGTGRYELRLANLGNTDRAIALRAWEDREDTVFHYRLAPAALELSRDASAIAMIEVEPKQRRHQPWWGKGREYLFFIDLEDRYNQPLPNKTLEARVLWQARPGWHLLLAVLGGLGGVAFLAFLIWWVFWRPPQQPQILEFASVAPSYHAADDDFIHLDWRISHPRRIQYLRVTGESPSGATPPQTLTFDLTQGLPAELADTCNWSRQLVCRNVRTDASQPGEYVFTLTVLPEGRDVAPLSQPSTVVAIAPLPNPDILELTAETGVISLNPDSPQPRVLQLRSLANLSQGADSETDQAEAILVNWQIQHPEQIAELRLVGRAMNGSVSSPLQRFDFRDGIPETLAPFCRVTETALICSRVPRWLNEPGEYVFELSVIPREKGTEAAISQKTDTVVIEAPEPPEIADFDTVQPIYSTEVGEPIGLNWQIANFDQLGAIAIESRNPEGVVNAARQRYDFRQGIPESLQNYCRASQGVLTCGNVPTNGVNEGEYRFKLSLFPQNRVAAPIATQESSLTKIIAPSLPFNIAQFQINGEPAPLKYITEVNPASPPREITLSWQVTGDPNVTVELSPAPGTVPTSGQVNYPLSQTSGQQTVTLTVTNDQGKRIERSLLLETVAVTPPYPTPRDRSDPRTPPSNVPSAPRTPIDLPPELRQLPNRPPAVPPEFD
jgi:hypothetical protein